jgi:selenocysteine-specific elongation factor
VRAGEWLLSRAWLAELRTELERRLDRAGPLDPGISPPAEPWAPEVIPLLGFELRGSKLYRPGATASLGDREEAAARLEEEVTRAGFEPVPAEDRELAAHLESQGRVVRVGDGLVISPRAYEQAQRAVVEECERAGAIKLARLRDLLGISRRPAQLVLERMDTDGLTRRVGDERVLRRKARVP